MSKRRKTERTTWPNDPCPDCGGKTVQKGYKWTVPGQHINRCRACRKVWVMELDKEQGHWRVVGPKPYDPAKDVSRSKKDSLCWTPCVHSAGPDMCCWAQFFEPVPGWTVEPASISGNNEHERLPTWRVIECPLFEAEKPRHNIS